MDVSILSKGESLASTWPKIGVGAITVAVNHAMVVAPTVDWLVMLDADRLNWKPVPDGWTNMIGLSPKQGVVTWPCNVDEARQVWPDKEIVSSLTLDKIGHDALPFSSLAALWFATQRLGATTLHLHGFDLGGKDYRGNEETIERGGRRWPEERRIISNVCRALRERGCVIHSYGAFKA